MATAIRFTYQDYLRLPEDRRCEMMDGELYMVPAPIQKVSRNLECRLHGFVMEHMKSCVWRKQVSIWFVSIQYNDRLRSRLLGDLTVPLAEVF